MATQCYIYIDGEWKEVISINIYNKDEEEWKEVSDFYVFVEEEFK